MTNLHATRRRAIAGALSAAALLAAAGCAAASAPPITSDQFVPGWQAHSRPLFNSGFARDSGMTSWYVPATLPRGTYVLVNREGDKAELIAGRQFQVDGSGERRLYMFVEPGYNDVEAIPAADVPAVKIQRRIEPYD